MAKIWIRKQHKTNKQIDWLEGMVSKLRQKGASLPVSDIDSDNNRMYVVTFAGKWFIIIYEWNGFKYQVFMVWRMN